MSKKVAIIIFFLVVYSLTCQVGKSGDRIIVNQTVILNEYTKLVANAKAGDNILSVSGPNLNNNNRFPSNLSQGDLLLIIQI